MTDESKADLDLAAVRARLAYGRVRPDDLERVLAKAEALEASCLRGARRAAELAAELADLKGSLDVLAEMDKQVAAAWGERLDAARAERDEARKERDQARGLFDEALEQLRQVLADW